MVRESQNLLELPEITLAEYKCIRVFTLVVLRTSIYDLTKYDSKKMIQKIQSKSLYKKKKTLTS